MSIRTLLIDADIIAYQIAVTNQLTWDWGPDDAATRIVNDPKVAFEEVDTYLMRLVDLLKADELIICLTHEYEYRKVILPSYKGHRDPAKKPELLKPLKEYLASEYNSYKRPGLEADDIMGILSTHPKIIPGEKVIVTIDKDLNQIPGLIFNPKKDTKPRRISLRDGDRFFLRQVLTGDTVDGYKGCPGVGPVKADRLLDVCDENWEIRYLWGRIVREYEAKGLTEDDALVQARVARICRWQDYDFKKKEVKLWQPPR